jgi:16S rRNA (cytidine1402-2'-O)-methyltransferase
MILHTENTNNKVKSGLYIVATPIGNLSDITLRALDVLKKSDYILCEDTRTSKNLLDRYEIKSKLISNHKFNEKKNLLKIIEILKSNCIVSLISDAGTPSVSDPGAILINECLANKIDIFPIPGASAEAPGIGKISILFLEHQQYQPLFQLVGLVKDIFFMVFSQKKVIN